MNFVILIWYINFMHNYSMFPYLSCNFRFSLTPKRFLFSKNLGNVQHTIKIIFSFFSSLWQKYQNLIRFQFVLEIDSNFLPVLLVVMFDLVIFVRVDSVHFVWFGNSEFRFKASLFPVYSPKTALVLAHQSFWVEVISNIYRLANSFRCIFLFLLAVTMWSTPVIAASWVTWNLLSKDFLFCFFSQRVYW